MMPKNLNLPLMLTCIILWAGNIGISSAHSLYAGIGMGREFGMLNTISYPMSLQGNLNQILLGYLWQNDDTAGWSIELSHYILESRIATLFDDQADFDYRFVKTHGRYSLSLLPHVLTPGKHNRLFARVGVLGTEIDYQRSGEIGSQPYQLNTSSMHYGPQIGLGNDILLSPHVTLRLEYDYAHFSHILPQCAFVFCPPETKSMTANDSIFAMSLLYALKPHSTSHRARSHPPPKHYAYIGFKTGIDNGSTLQRDPNSPLFYSSNQLINFSQLYSTDGIGLNGYALGLYTGYLWHLPYQTTLGTEIGLTRSFQEDQNVSMQNDFKGLWFANFSILPGYQLNNHNLIFARFGIARNAYVVKALNLLQPQRTIYHSTGPQMGIGYETYLTPNLKLRGEYDYTHYNNQESINLGIGHFRMPLKHDEFNIGLTYIFTKHPTKVHINKQY